MKHKVGDVVQIKSLDWYNEKKKSNGIVETSIYFLEEMSKYCGKIPIITNIIGETYKINLDEGDYTWTDDMFEEIVREPDKVSDNPKPIKDSPKEIDWEQRRYEMMKYFAAACIANGSCGSSDNDIDGVVYMSKRYVDAIEKQLKSGTL